MYHKYNFQGALKFVLKYCKYALKKVELQVYYIYKTKINRFSKTKMGCT